MRFRRSLALVCTTALTASLVILAGITGAGAGTVLLQCEDVPFRARFSAPQTDRNAAEGIVTRSGIGFQTKDLHVTYILHPEGRVADALPTERLRYEVDDWITPRAGYTADWYDSDTCSGALTLSDATAAADAMVPDFSASPHGPLYRSSAPEAPLGEIMKITGKLQGRGSCDPAGNEESAWSLHGKLVLQWAQGKSPAADVVHRDDRNRTVTSQVYVSLEQDASLNVDLNMDTVGDTPDRLRLVGAVIKGVGNGSKVQLNGAYRPPFASLVEAAEACSFNFDLNGDNKIGGGQGGLDVVVIDTDLDTFSDGTPTGGTGIEHLYDGSLTFETWD